MALRSTPAPSTPEETLATLTDLARRRTLPLAPERLAAHVVTVTEGADWPVRRAALDALLRRLAFLERDELRVIARPKGGVFGVYATGRPGARREGARPWRTELESLDPLRGSCDCPDYVLGSLGACKHLLCVAATVLASERDRKRAARGPLPATGPRLVWDPVRPLEGEGDRVLGLSIEGPLPRALAKHFGAERDGAHVVDRAAATDSARRVSLLADLARAVERGLSAQPGAARLVADEHERAARLHAAGRDAERLLAHTKDLSRALYPYQREGVRRFLAAERLLLADDMGLGKTTQAIAACHALLRAKRVTRGLLVVPAALKPQWVREWQATTSAPIVAVDGTPEERAAMYAGLRGGFAVIGYEQLLRDFSAVQALAPEMVVLDEAQRIKNYATKSAVYVKALAPRYRLVLTGTPMENRLEELASLLDWVDEVALAPKWRLDAWHTAPDGRGARHLDTLRARLAPSVVRRVRQEVIAELPPRTDTRVDVAMTEQQRAAHDELVQPIAALVRRAERRALSQPEFLRLMSLLTTQRIISNGLGQLNFEEVWPAYVGARPDDALLEGLFAPKLVELRRLVEEIALRQGRKIVIFSQWLRMLRLAHWSLGDLLADHGVRAAFFTGDESQKRRTQNVVDFHDDPDVRLLFLSDAGGVGLNLQRAASACINLELPWNPAVLEQRVGRIYRLGQSRPIDVYHLVSEYGIESRIADLVATKRALFSGLFDSTTDEIRYESERSFLADVEKLVAEAPAPVAATADATEDGEVDAPAEGGGSTTSDLETAAPAEGVPPAEPVAVPAAAAAAARAPSVPVRELFSRLSVRRTEGGGVAIEAPPEAAAELAALFEGMARLIAGARAG
jgi:hypothetical protein